MMDWYDCRGITHKGMKIELTKEELAVLMHLRDETERDGELCAGFDYLTACDTYMDVTRDQVAKACRKLREYGFAEFYRGLMNEDGEVSGSGYCISYDGEKYLDPCDVCGELATAKITYDPLASSDPARWIKEGGDKEERTIRECNEHYKQSPKHNNKKSDV